MKKIRFIALALAAVMTAAVASACTPSDNGESETTGSATKENDGLYVAEYLPDTTYDGKSFRIGVFGENVVDIQYEDCKSVVDEALYRRNSIIEQRYDVEITDVVVSDTYDGAYLAYMDNYTAGESIYECSKNIMRNAWLAATQGAVVPVNNLQYCDTTQDWYIKFVNEELTIGDTLFYAYTYEADTIYRAICGVIYNKEIYGDMQDVPDLYEKYESGEWTIELMYELAKAASKDNGDSEWNIEDDIFGIICEDDMWVPEMWIGSGMKLVAKDEDNMPYFAGSKSEKLIDILLDAYDIWLTDGVVYEGFTNRGQVAETLTADCASFASGHALFYTAGLYWTESLTDMEADFGILPCPKYDETQENYYSRVCDGHANCVPVSNTDLDFTSVILESMAVESLNYCVPAYFDNAVENRYLRDAEKDKPIVSLMMANATIDLGDSIWMSSMRSAIINCYRNGNNSFASTFAAYKTVFDKTISNDISAISEVIENFN